MSSDTCNEKKTTGPDDPMYGHRPVYVEPGWGEGQLPRAVVPTSLGWFHYLWTNPEAGLQTVKYAFNGWFTLAWETTFAGIPVAPIKLDDLGLPALSSGAPPTIPCLNRDTREYSRTSMARISSPNMSAAIYDLMRLYKSPEAMFKAEVIDPLIQQVSQQIFGALLTADTSMNVGLPEPLPITNVEDFLNNKFAGMGKYENYRCGRLIIVSPYMAERLGYNPDCWSLAGGDRFVVLDGCQDKTKLMFVLPQTAIRIQVVESGEKMRDTWSVDAPRARLYFRAPAYDDRQNVVARAHLDMAVAVDADQLMVFNLSADGPVEPAAERS